MFSPVDPQALEQCFRQWMASTAPPLPREVVAVDDKMTSCPDAPAVLIEAIRRHWAIENSVHWVRDVVFREDDARSRDHVATRSFAVLRKRAFNLLQQGKHQPGSLRWSGEIGEIWVITSQLKGKSLCHKTTAL